MVAAEFGRLREREKFLERELHSAQADGPEAVIDEAMMTQMLGEEAVRVLTTARESAHEIREKAEQAAAQMLHEAADEAARVREEADIEASRRRADAAADAESELSMAKQQGREMVNEARAYRERVLSELARRRELAREQIEQLIHGRDRLMQSFERARLVAVDVVAEMQPLGEPDEYVNLTPTTGPLPVMIANSPRPAEPVAEQPAAVPEADAQVAALRAADRTEEFAVVADEHTDDDTDGADAQVVDGTGGLRIVEIDDDGRVDADAIDADTATLPADTDAVETETDTDTGTDTDADAEHADVAETEAESDTEAELDIDADADEAVDDTDTAVAGTETETEVAAEAEPDPDLEEDTDAELFVMDDADDAETDTVAAAEGDHEADDDVADDVVVDLFARLRADAATDTATDTAADDATADDTADSTSADDDTVFAAVESAADAQPVVEGSDEDVWSPEVRAAAELASNEADDVVTDTVDDMAAEALDDAEPTAFEARDEAITPLIVASAKKLKRALADEQNDVLDALRRIEGLDSIDVLLPAPGEHVARYTDAIADDLLDAVHAGSATSHLGDRNIRKALATESVQVANDALSKWLVLPLRERLTRCVEDGAGDNAVITKKVRAVYREWKTQRIDETLDDVLRCAHGRGVLAGFDAGTPIVWEVDTRFPACPDCEDNALAGAVASGDDFPTGDTFAPAHPGCRCLLVAADR